MHRSGIRLFLLSYSIRLLLDLCSSLLCRTSLFVQRFPRQFLPKVYARSRWRPARADKFLHGRMWSHRGGKIETRTLGSSLPGTEKVDGTLAHFGMVAVRQSKWQKIWSLLDSRASPSCRVKHDFASSFDSVVVLSAHLCSAHCGFLLPLPRFHFSCWCGQSWATNDAADGIVLVWEVNDRAEDLSRFPIPPKLSAGSL